MAKCNKCGKNSMDGLKFCTYCGAQISSNHQDKTICTRCRSANPKGVKFCLSCGNSLFNNINNEEVILLKKKSVKKRKTPKIMVGVAGILIIAILVSTLLPKMIKTITISQNSSGGEVKWEFEGDIDEKLAGKPAPIELSGSKPINISTKDGFTVSAPENALDKDRKFEVKRIEDEKFEELFFNPVYEELFTIAAYEMHAGLEDSEIFPGDVKLSFDLEKYNIPKAAYEDIRVVRRGEKDGDVEILNGNLNGSTYECHTNKNSIIEVVVITGIGVSLLFGILGKYEHDKRFTDAFGTDGKWNRMIYSKDSTYTLYWPSGLGMANPDAVRAALMEEVQLYKDLKYVDPSYNPKEDIEKAIEGEKTFNAAQILREHIKKNAIKGVTNKQFYEYVLSIIDDHPEYKKLKYKYNDEWKMNNVWPAEVKVCVEQLMRADGYLFKHRKLKKPSSVEVFMSNIITEYGFSFNPSTGKPYLTVGLISKKNLQNLNSGESKKWLDNYLVTICHELFHVVQSARYIYGIDWKSNAWFWEATATLLENEAADYFKNNKDKLSGNKPIISSGFTVEKHSYAEAYIRPPIMTSYWGELEDNDEAKQNQGYMFGYFLIFLRDRYYGGESGEFAKDNFLIRLLDAYKGSIRNPFYIIIKQTSNSEKLTRNDIRQFYEAVGGDVADRTLAFRVAEKSSRIKGSISVFKPWVIIKEVILNETSPIIKTVPVKNPYSTLVRVIDVKIDKNKYKKDDVKLVLIKGKEDMQAKENFMLRVSGDGQNYDFQYLDEEGGQEYKDIAYGEQIYIQELHLYGDSWFGDFSENYKAFLMLKPEPPKLEEKADSNNKDKKTLIITMPKKSPLYAEGLVKKWRVTFTDPSGKTITFETDKDQYEIPISNKDGRIDFNDPQIRKDMKAGLQTQLEKDPELKKGFEKEYDANLDKLVDDFVSGIDLGAVIQSAQIIAHGGINNQYTVSVCEIAATDKPIYGPESDNAVLESKFSAAGTDLTGTWKGKLAFTNEIMTVVISQGSDGHDYIMKMDYYGGASVYLDDLGNGRLKVAAIKGSIEDISLDEAAVGYAMDGMDMTLNNENEIQMLSPPCTLKRQK